MRCAFRVRLIGCLVVLAFCNAGCVTSTLWSGTRPQAYMPVDRVGRSASNPGGLYVEYATMRWSGGHVSPVVAHFAFHERDLVYEPLAASPSPTSSATNSEASPSTRVDDGAAEMALRAPADRVSALPVDLAWEWSEGGEPSNRVDVLVVQTPTRAVKPGDYPYVETYSRGRRPSVRNAAPCYLVPKMPFGERQWRRTGAAILTPFAVVVDVALMPIELPVLLVTYGVLKERQAYLRSSEPAAPYGSRGVPTTGSSRP